MRKKSGIWISLFVLLISCTSQKALNGPPLPSNVQDADHDGVADRNDNCPTISNADQKDGDRDGIGDLCEVLICPANACTERGLVDGFYCDGSASVHCGIDKNRCVSELSHYACSYRCGSNGRCEARPPAEGDPEIQNVTGPLVDGQQLEITGLNFGTHNLNYTWLGGVNGPINTSVDKAAEELGVPGWQTGINSWGQRTPRTLSTFAVRPNRTRSMVQKIWPELPDTNDSQWGYVPGMTDDLRPPNPFEADTSFEYNELYASWWEKRDVYDMGEPLDYPDGQLKEFALESNHHLWNIYPGSLQVGSNYTDFGASRIQLRAPVVCGGCFSLPPCCTDNGITCAGLGFLYTSTDACFGGTQYAKSMINDAGLWTRHELYVRANPPPDFQEPEASGIFQLIEQPVGQAAFMSYNKTDIVFFAWEYEDTWQTGFKCSACTNPVVGTGKNWHNWNSFSFIGFAKGRITAQIDDVYLQFGNRARLLIGNAPVYDNCSHFEIQAPSAWSPTGITATFNLGSFQPTEDLYLFIVDESGNASPGKALGRGSRL